MTTALVSGPESLIRIVAQQLAWLGAVCRTSSPADRLAYCDTIWTKDPSRVVSSFTIRYNIVRFNVEDQKGCWHKLLSNSVIATGFPIPKRPEDMIGLQIPLKIMAALGNISIAVNDSTGFVLSGDRFGFVPVERKQDAVQWHLIHKDGDELDLEDVLQSGHKRLPEEELDEKALHSSTAFLGWTPKVHNYAGAGSSRRNLPVGAQGPLERGIDYHSIGPSRGSAPRTGVSLTSLQLNISKIVGIGATVAIAKKDRPTWMPEISRYKQILDTLQTTSVVLYDTETQVAWFIDAERLALQMALHRLELQRQKDGTQTVEINPAEPDVPSSLRRSMLLNREIVMESDYDVKDRKVVDCIFAEMVSRDQQIIHILASKSRNVTRRTLSWTKKICGWEYMDFIDNKLSRSQSLAEINNERCGKWPDLVDSLNSLVLLGSNFQEIFQPADISTHCQSCRSVPQKESLLAMEVTSLQALTKGATAPNGQRRLSKSNITWDASVDPFSPCNNPAADTCRKRYIQRLHEGNPRGHLNLEDFSSGAVVFGEEASKLQKPDRQTSQKPSVTQLVDKSLSAVPFLTSSSPASSRARINIPEVPGGEFRSTEPITANSEAPLRTTHSVELRQDALLSLPGPGLYATSPGPGIMVSANEEQQFSDPIPEAGPNTSSSSEQSEESESHGGDGPARTGKQSDSAVERQQKGKDRAE